MQLTEPVFTYNEFYIWMQNLAKTGKTSGNNQTQVLADFTALNRRRMSRLNKTLILDNELKNALDTISEEQQWVVITEAWCGDSAQCLPVIGKIAEYLEKINLKIVLRYKNPALMEQYLSNGSQSIPKLIAFNSNDQELLTWGPRPFPAQELLRNWKKDPAGRNWEAFEMELHTWYSRDKTKTMQQEFLQLLQEL